MAIAIDIRADDSSASEVERLWDQVAAFEDEPSMRALGYRPHFTFAIYDSPEIEEKTTWEAMLRAVKDEAQLRIEFRRIRWFVGPPLVLWAEPAADQALARWHASISAIIVLPLISPENRQLQIKAILGVSRRFFLDRGGHTFVDGKSKPREFLTERLRRASSW